MSDIKVMTKFLCRISLFLIVGKEIMLTVHVGSM